MSRVFEFEKFLKTEIAPIEDRELYQVGIRTGHPKLIIRLAYMLWLKLTEEKS